MEVYGWSGGICNLLLTSALDGSELWTSRPFRFNPSEIHAAHWLGGWVGPRASERFVEQKNLLPLTRYEPRTVEPVPSRYVNYVSLLRV